MEKSTRFRHLRLALLLVLVYVGNPLDAQFEQKLSISLYAGGFTTLGTEGWEPDWYSDPSELEPTLMPNFKPGFSLGGSFQLNLNRHWSLEGFMHFMGSLGWYFDASDSDQAAFNYLYYEVYADTVDYNILFSGENEMTLSNLVIGLAPKYYFAPASKINPFVSLGISYHITYVNFIDNITADYEVHGLEAPEYGDEHYWFSDHQGIGMSVGAGVEYAVNEYLGLFLQAGYHFLPLKEEAFLYGIKYADFHALQLHLGMRLSFLKSKEF